MLTNSYTTVRTPFLSVFSSMETSCDNAMASNKTLIGNNLSSTKSVVDLISSTVLPSDDQICNHLQCHCCQLPCEPTSSRPCILVQTSDDIGLTQCDMENTWGRSGGELQDTEHHTVLTYDYLQSFLVNRRNV